MRRRTYLSTLAASALPYLTNTRKDDTPTEEQIKQALGEYAFTHETEEYIEFFYETATLRVYYYKNSDSFEYSIGLADFIELPNLSTTRRAVQKGKQWEYEARQESENRYVKELDHTTSNNTVQYRISTEGERTENVYHNETLIQEADIIPIVTGVPRGGTRPGTKG